MKQPAFLALDDVERLHRILIDQFGGIHGVRDRGSIESAVAHPQNVYLYSECDLANLAAAYAFHIAEAQAFLDGNKRIGIAAAISFLEENGCSVRTETDTLYAAMIGIASREVNRLDLAAIFRRITTFPE
jgi:death-on-curing protein